MKEFIKKDMLYIKAYHKMNLIISLLFIISAAVNFGNNLLAAYGMLFLTMISTALISYDESEQFIYYAVSLPKGRSKLVSSKYISNLILCAGGLLLAVISYFIGGRDDGTLLMLLTMLIFVSMTVPSFMLLFNFVLGTKKGRLPGILALGAVFGAAGVAANFGIANGEGGLPLLTAFTIAAVSSVLYAVSWCIALIIYKKKSF